MSRLSWIAPLYGYLVCVIAVITFLVNISGFIDASFDRMNPLASGRSYGPYGGSLNSFESFRATYEGARPTRPGPAPAAGTAADTLTTAELRQRYEALRADQLMLARHQSTQRLVKHGLLLVVAVVLFLTHWMWARRQREGAAG
ncbi:MAG TPA: hypothetical protein VFO66_00965 [Gemmatimonadaceae bacterium]|nr:hypothetical protein [Gemmatimonadaceae bacterium]